MLLTGGIAVCLAATACTSTARPTASSCSAPGGAILGRYDKAHLVPYGEYLPMRPLLSAIGLSRLAPGDIDFDAGPGPAHDRPCPALGQGRLPALLRDHLLGRGRRPRATAPTSSSTRRTTPGSARWGPPQHLAQARLRAAEEGIPVIRSTPTGISAVIDAHGDVVKVAAVAHRRRDRRRASAAARSPTLFARLRQCHPAAARLRC